MSITKNDYRKIIDLSNEVDNEAFNTLWDLYENYFLQNQFTEAATSVAVFTRYEGETQHYYRIIYLFIPACKRANNQHYFAPYSVQVLNVTEYLILLGQITGNPSFHTNIFYDKNDTNEA